MNFFQTIIYRVVFIDFYWGWDYTDEILFESAMYDNATMAMVEFSFCEPAHPNWFATMRLIKNGLIIEEDLFDSSVIEVNEVGDVVG